MKQPWIHNAKGDLTFIIAPGFLAVFAVLLLEYGPFDKSVLQEVPPFAWLFLVVFVDVAHVYSTLWRTYFDPEEFRRFRMPLLLAPAIGLVVGIGLYLIGEMVFWRVLAYLAVYHFVRQQYGFMMIYARKDAPGNNLYKWIDRIAIYMATLYPLIWWHTHPGRVFNWFIPGDFILVQQSWISDAAFVVYCLAMAVYIAKEGIQISKTGTINLPKNLLLVSTALTWYIGIIALNGDLAFTLTNVIAHGIPYMALVWYYGRKKRDQNPKPYLKRVFSRRFIPIFIGLLLMLAYFEEGLWDGLVWRDHESLFGLFSPLPWLAERPVMAILVPLLTLPQLTHYIIDGFIWRMRGKDPSIQKVL